MKDVTEENGVIISWLIYRLVPGLCILHAELSPQGKDRLKTLKSRQYKVILIVTECCICAALNCKLGEEALVSSNAHTE